MARPFKSVKNINDSKKLWKLTVKIHHKSTMVSKNKQHFDMILVDKEWHPLLRLRKTKKVELGLKRLSLILCWERLRVLTKAVMVAEYIVPNIRSIPTNRSMKPTYFRFLTV